MNTAYLVLTNKDLLGEITKWHILKYMGFPDIFISIITDDKNIHQMKFLLKDKFVTLESLFKMLKPQLDHHDDYYKNINVKTPVKIGSVIEYLFWKEDSFELFKYIFNNYPDEKEKILNLDILTSSPLKTIMQCANFNQKDIWTKKLNLIMVYKELDMSQPDFPPALAFGQPIGIGQYEGHVGNVIGKDFTQICDAPDRNCGKTINNFGDVLKYIPLKNVDDANEVNLMNMHMGHHGIGDNGMGVMHIPFIPDDTDDDDEMWEMEEGQHEIDDNVMGVMHMHMGHPDSDDDDAPHFIN